MKQFLIDIRYTTHISVSGTAPFMTDCYANKNAADRSSSRSLPICTVINIFAVAALNVEVCRHLHQLGSQQSMVKAEVWLSASYIEKHVSFMCFHFQLNGRDHS